MGDLREERDRRGRRKGRGEEHARNETFEECYPARHIEEIVEGVAFYEPYGAYDAERYDKEILPQIIPLFITERCHRFIIRYTIPMDKHVALAELEKEMAANRSLPLQESNLVFGEGNIDCEVMFVGEAPGVNEDRLKRPFVG